VRRLRRVAAVREGAAEAVAGAAGAVGAAEGLELGKREVRDRRAALRAPRGTPDGRVVVPDDGDAVLGYLRKVD